MASYNCAIRVYNSDFFSERSDLRYLASTIRSCCFKLFYAAMDKAERYLGEPCCKDSLDEAYEWLHNWTEFKERTGEYQYESDKDDWENYYSMCSRNEHYYNDDNDEDDDELSY